ncbi:ubiquitin-related modifier [Babesia ovis]|uniref:Ubiquitin-related modifier 1 n=1 Tax=Babesia ovis TaxID=5869 RepID=A0A9W5TBE2_BABOV|nr:ubiquitin-related modifier [Babesia ovis]
MSPTKVIDLREGKISDRLSEHPEAELTVSQLVAYVRKTAFAGRKDMFSEPPEVISSDCQQVEVQGDLPGQLTLSERSRVRPGVLVLVDDVDWELLGSGDCIIKGSKSISFISSLHGG